MVDETGEGKIRETRVRKKVTHINRKKYSVFSATTIDRSILQNNLQNSVYDFEFCHSLILTCLNFLLFLVFLFLTKVDHRRKKTQGLILL